MPRKLPQGEGKRHPVSFRTTLVLNERLKAEAMKSGRSMSQEIERRLEASFRDDDLRALIRDELHAALDGLTLVSVDDDDLSDAAATEH